MKTIPHRELRNNSTKILRSVQSGESYEVTDNGEVVALLTPPTSADLRGARFRVPLSRGGFSGLPRISPPVSVGDVLHDFRDER
jgi:prevent-host-death family protein